MEHSRIDKGLLVIPHSSFKIEISAIYAISKLCSRHCILRCTNFFSTSFVLLVLNSTIYVFPHLKRFFISPQPRIFFWNLDRLITSSKVDKKRTNWSSQTGIAPPIARIMAHCSQISVIPHCRCPINTASSRLLSLSAKGLILFPKEKRFMQQVTLFMLKNYSTLFVFATSKLAYFSSRCFFIKIVAGWQVAYALLSKAEVSWQKYLYQHFGLHSGLKIINETMNLSAPLCLLVYTSNQT